MSAKYLFALLSVLFVLAGCNLTDRQQSPSLAQTPPYLQPQSDRTQSQLAELRAFHERESAKMSEDLRVVHNREMAQLETTGKEMQRDKPRYEDYGKTQERKATWMSWTNWFKKTDKNG